MRGPKAECAHATHHEGACHAMGRAYPWVPAGRLLGRCITERGSVICRECEGRSTHCTSLPGRAVVRNQCRPVRRCRALRLEWPELPPFTDRGGSYDCPIGRRDSASHLPTVECLRHC